MEYEVPDKVKIEAGKIEEIQDLFYVGMSRKINPLRKSRVGIELNIGAGKYKEIIGTINLDYPQFDAEKDAIPYETGMVEVIHLYHVLEHLKNPKHLLYECQRVLRVGGHINIVVPYYNSSLYASCLDHKTMFNERTWNNTFNNYSYDDPYEWQLEEHVNFIMGVEEKNLALFTQLVKV